MVSAPELRGLARTLRNLIEPIAGSVYFAPEVQWKFAELGLPTTPAADGASAWETHEAGAAAYGPQYFCSRSACMGLLSGDAVAAIFGFFEPSVVRKAIRQGWSITTPEEVLQARLTGVEEALQRMWGTSEDLIDAERLNRAADLLLSAIEGAVMASHPIAAGLAALPLPASNVGRLWRAADIVREHRGDSHNNAWASCGLDPIQINLLTEMVRGMPSRSHVRTRAWSEDQIDEALDGLRERGLVQGNQITREGQDIREQVEKATDLQESGIVSRIEPYADELLEMLYRWSLKILDEDGYHVRPEKLMGPAMTNHSSI